MSPASVPDIAIRPFAREDFERIAALMIELQDFERRFTPYRAPADRDFASWYIAQLLRGLVPGPAVTCSVPTDRSRRAGLRRSGEPAQQLRDVPGREVAIGRRAIGREATLEVLQLDHERGNTLEVFARERADCDVRNGGWRHAALRD